MAEPAGRGNPVWLAALFALAWAGGAVAYMPFLTILLPGRVADLAGPVTGISWLAYLSFAGAIAASAGAIGLGYLSDVTRNRRGWIAAGLVLSCILLVVSRAVHSLPGLIVVVSAWQLALNMMLGPLAAMAAEQVPDNQKGLFGGFLAFAPGLGALAGALVTLPGVPPSLFGADARLVLVALMVSGCIAPVLLLRVARPAEPRGAVPLIDEPAPYGRATVIRMWLGRLAVQVSEAALFAFLFFWLRSLDPGLSDHVISRIFSITVLVSAPLALLSGRWADRHSRPFLPLVGTAAASGLGLLAMALAPSLDLAIAAYALFGVASSIFLALHTAQTLRILPDPRRRARDLGLFNLTNTVPQLVVPWIALALIPTFGFSGLFVVLAALAGAACLLLLPIIRHP